MSTLDIVVGGQFGSEAKGHVTKRVIERILTDRNRNYKVVNVRVAGPNAGHCVLDANGVKFAMRSLPVGFVFPEVKLFIAAGSEIDLPVLIQEVVEAREHGHQIAGRLFVHPEATLLTQEHKIKETGMHERIGSTGKGIGAARADRIMRKAQRVMDDSNAVAMLHDYGIVVGDLLAMTGPQHVVIEGTQGYGLGLHAGHYPQCTSSNTRAIDFAAMAGVNPWDYDSFIIWVVARVYPIRVAGNSGPLKGETTWDDLGLPEELTTVTKKVRRVGAWDGDLVREAINANGRYKVSLALTMLDQKFPQYADVRGRASGNPEFFTNDVETFLAEITADVEKYPSLVTTGEDTAVWMR